MTRAACLVLVFAASATAAPPPKEPEAAKLKRVWGETTDTDKDCTFALDGDKLKITIPGTPHLFRSANVAGIAPKDNYPSAVRPAEGDFMAVLKLEKSPPARGALNKGAFAAAGIVLTAGETRVSISVAHWLDGTGESEQSIVRFHVRSPQMSAGSSVPLAKDGSDLPGYLRLTRVGNRVRADCGTDGKKWKSVNAMDFEVPVDVSVGVFAEANGGKAYEAVFESLTVSKAPK